MKFNKENMRKVLKSMENVNKGEAQWRDAEYVKGYADAIKIIKFFMDVKTEG